MSKKSKRNAHLKRRSKRPAPKYERCKNPLREAGIERLISIKTNMRDRAAAVAESNALTLPGVREVCPPTHSLDTVVRNVEPLIGLMALRARIAELAVKNGEFVLTGPADAPLTSWLPVEVPADGPQ